VPTLATIVADSQLRMLFQQYMKAEHSDEQFDFYFLTEGNQVKFNKYIRPGAPREVNIDSRTRQMLRNLAAQGRWNDMTAPLKDAKQQVGGGMLDMINTFSTTPAYVRWHVAKYKTLTDKGQKAFNLLKRNLGVGKKEADLKALMLIVEGGRTPTDRKTAFKQVNKMMKLLVKAETHFRAAGLPVPA